MTYFELLTLVTDLLIDLNSINYGPKTAPDEVQQYDEQVNRLNALRRKLSRETLDLNTSRFKELTESLQKINDELQKNIFEVAKIAKTLDNLIKFISVLDQIISTASRITSVPDLISHALAVDNMRVKSTRDLRMMAIRAESESMPQASSVEEKTAPLLLVEEVLHGVELTPEKLIITVATGGCTNEGSFRFDVNKGTTGQMPYMVTVYRIEPDDCRGNFEPIQISYSREELGLGGAVEFVLRNKIGNTSQHRLVG